MALSAGTDHITIHLNGHTISGGNALQGIHVVGFQTSLDVCGKPFSGNTVAGNTFRNIGTSAVFLRDGSSNKVTDNTIENSRNGIVIGSGISNEVAYNHIQRGTYGVGLWPQLSGGCNAGGATVPTIGFTFIASNKIAKQHLAVSLGSNLKLRRVLKNRIGKNLLQDSSYGLWFNADTADNDARCNFFPDSCLPITADGSGNLY